jgi:hypothetical protein
MEAEAVLPLAGFTSVGIFLDVQGRDGVTGASRPVLDVSKPIVRHIKIIASASAYGPTYRQYFERRARGKEVLFET